MRLRTLIVFVLLGIGCAVPAVSFAVEIISEIMYDLPGTDTGREWVEVQNTGSEDVSFLKWKFFEANTNHGLTLFQGNATTSADGFAIIADDPVKFLLDNPGYSGTLFGSSFSLSNGGETLELKSDGASLHQATYTSSMGGAGDGNSLHYLHNAWQAGIPTPGRIAAEAASTTPSASSTSPVAEVFEPNTIPPTSAPQPASYGATTWVYKPQIYVNAFVPQKGVAGAPVLFDAAAVGVKKEPLPNARYVWSFGDGGTAEGKKIYHTYHYPAVYTVLVDASSGEWSATDRKEIVISAPELVISRIKDGENGFIEVQNNGKDEVDLSLWLLKSGANIFTIPQRTFVGSRKTIPFPAAITALSADPSSTALLYPNGNPVVVYGGERMASESTPTEAEKPIAASPRREETKPEKPIPPVAAEPVKKEAAPLPIPSPATVSKISTVPPAQAASLSRTKQESNLAGVTLAETNPSLTPWLLWVALLLLIAVGAYLLMLRPKPEPGAAEKLRKEAEEYDIVEEVGNK